MDVLSKITFLRKQRDWTIWKLSEESGVDQSTISAWYKKGRSPSISSLEKICDACGITMAQFFTENNTVELTVSQKEMLDNWNVLNKEQKEIMLLLVKNMPRKND